MNEVASRRNALAGLGIIGTTLAIATRAEAAVVTGDVLVSTEFGTAGATSTTYTQAQVDALVLAAQSSGKPIYWPSGVHYIDGRISFSFPLTMIGAGSQLIGPRRGLGSDDWGPSDFSGTRLVFRQVVGVTPPLNGGYLATVPATGAVPIMGAALPTLTIRALTILGPSIPSESLPADLTAAGIQLGSVTEGYSGIAVRCRIDDVIIANFSLGLRGVLENSTISNLYVVGCGTGVDLLPFTNGNVFTGLNIEFCTRSALRLNNADANVFAGGVIQNNDGTTDPIVKIHTASQANVFTGIYFENWATGSERYSIVSVGIVSVGVTGEPCYGIEFIECHWGSMPNSVGSIRAQVAIGAGSLVVVRAHDMSFRASVAQNVPDPLVTIKAPGRGSIFEGAFLDNTFEGLSGRTNTVINTYGGSNYQRLNRAVVRTYRDAGGAAGTLGSLVNIGDDLFVIGNRATATIRLPLASTLPDGWSVQIIASSGGGDSQNAGVHETDQAAGLKIRSKGTSPGLFANDFTVPIGKYESKTFIWMASFGHWVAY